MELSRLQNSAVGETTIDFGPRVEYIVAVMTEVSAPVSTLNLEEHRYCASADVAHPWTITSGRLSTNTTHEKLGYSSNGYGWVMEWVAPDWRAEVGFRLDLDRHTLL